MANTYTLITSTSLSTTAATVTFSAIPATFDNLVLLVSARGDSSGEENLQWYFNTDTSTNYGGTYMQGSGSAPSSNRYTNQTLLQNPNTLTGTTYTSNTFSTYEIYIPGYKLNQNKPISSFGTAENNATLSYINAEAHLWRNTATINQIVIDQSGANFVAGSTFWLYGIKNS